LRRRSESFSISRERLTVGVNQPSHRRQNTAERRTQKGPGQNGRQEIQRAKIIKLADKTSNMRAISARRRIGRLKRRLEYIGWAREVVKGLRGASPALSDNSTMPPLRQKARSPSEVQSGSEGDSLKLSEILRYVLEALKGTSNNQGAIMRARGR
jgi:hypothetical protein